jgi:DNA modification methylase/transcriptional regulator with XRE-family HTH domain
VQCVVTSPPYWGLRDYGLTPSVWDGDGAHAHEWGEETRRESGNAPSLKSTLTTNNGRGPQSGDKYHAENAGTVTTGAFCSCGAWRGVLGLEPTPELYVQHLVEIFREVRRVLRTDGTVWCNLGDSFQGKQLVGIPWRVAFALQADGWWLRSDIIWAKPNPMPESITDRPTKSHEYLFLLTKAARYYYDGEAIKEEGTGRTAGNVDPIKGTANGDPFFRTREGFLAVADKPWISRNRRSVWTIATEPYPEAHFATFPEKLVEPCILAGTSERGACPTCGAPWARETSATQKQPWSVLGEMLRTRREQAGMTRAQLAACLDAGANPYDWELGGHVPSERHWARLANVLAIPESRDAFIARAEYVTTGVQDGPKRRAAEAQFGVARPYSERKIRTSDTTIGWSPTCACPPAESVPCRVLDPFAGSGTTVAVAERLGRVGIGVELKAAYLRLAWARTRQAGLL